MSLDMINKLPSFPFVAGDGEVIQEHGGGEK